MKKGLILIVIIAVMLLVGMEHAEKPALTEEQIKEIQEAVLKSHLEIIKDAESLDADKFYESILDGGKATIVQDGIIMSRKESLEMTKMGFEGLKKLKYEFSKEAVKVLSPETAIYTGQGKAMFTFYSDETVDRDFAVTSVFVLKDGRWKIIHGHHSTPKTDSF